MKLSQLIRKREPATATVATLATLAPITTPSVATVASVAVANPKTNIASCVTQNDESEKRRQRVIAMLEAAPETKRAIYADDTSDPDNVILTVAVRACQQTCELLIPKAKYDPWRLLELIERHGGTEH